MIHPAAGGVMIEHLIQCGQAPVVHVGRGNGDVPQRRRTKLPDVFGLVRPFVEPAIGRGVFRSAGIEESAANLFTAFKPDAAAEVPSAVALKARAALAGEEYDFAAF